MQRKKRIHYYNQRTDACKMHIHVLMNIMFYYINTAVPINLL